MDAILERLEEVQSWLFQGGVLPALHAAGLMSYAGDAYDATGLFVLGVAQLGLIVAVLRPLEACVPVERWEDRRAVRPDVIYTLLTRTGALPLAFFLILQPALNPLERMLRTAGYLPPNLEELTPLLAAHPLAGFLAYVLVIDFFEYWRHRLQHRFRWWWALHALHHSQRHMSFWTDDRNHVLDGLLEALWLALLGIAIGIPSQQFVFAVALLRFVENLAHANVRFGFGRLGDRLLVSPRYHRIHHAIGAGHEGRARGCNFATLLPLWDVLFGTANFDRGFPPTGIRDQLEGVDYGEGFLRQQWLGLRRLGRALRPGPAPR